MGECGGCTTHPLVAPPTSALILDHSPHTPQVDSEELRSNKGVRDSARKTKSQRKSLGVKVTYPQLVRVRYWVGGEEAKELRILFLDPDEGME